MREAPVETNVSELLDDWRRKQDALEEIAKTCEAINFPPQLVTDLIAIARAALEPRSYRD